MAIRKHSSLQWLIDKRAQLHGDFLNDERILARHIKKADAEIEKINLALSRAYKRRNQQVPTCAELIEKTKIGWRIIDSAIEMHEVKIDP
ncbi:hypothetical protein J2X56_001800 [Herbaspirillum sp. 1173]|uniref:hypothetical protein n=1 Tax=Herbaspirillum sp. 1173 TaxID=2817734 RepID=UPI0028623569|nr:hypothetical protein [Herbaspirillum sp. 1173]MDR6739786.1 hypothetical protein [Herbaspirillum sp. 1173]